MTILVLYLTQNNHVLLPVVAASLCSLLLGVVFVLYLPILIEKNYQDHWGMCIAYSSVGSVYMLVEVLAMIGAVPSFFDDNKGLIAIGILTLSSLIVLLSNTYLHFYVVGRVEQRIKLQKTKVSQATVTFLEEQPFGGILVLFTSYTILLFILACWFGIAFSDYTIHNIILLRVFGGTILFVLPGLSVFFGLKYPRKLFISKLQIILDEHNQALKNK